MKGGAGRAQRRRKDHAFEDYYREIEADEGDLSGQRTFLVSEPKTGDTAPGDA